MPIFHTSFIKSPFGDIAFGIIKACFIQGSTLTESFTEHPLRSVTITL